MSKPGLVRNEQNYDLNLHCFLSVFVNARNKRMCKVRSVNLSYFWINCNYYA